MTVTAAADMGTMMLELASLSFLGFGAVAPTPEWGLMLNEGRTYMAKAPWLMIAPGIAIVIVVIVFNMLGDSIRDRGKGKQGVDENGFRVPAGNVTSDKNFRFTFELRTEKCRGERVDGDHESRRVDVQCGGG